LLDSKGQAKKSFAEFLILKMRSIWSSIIEQQ
jgi:hypothetical protein